MLRNDNEVLPLPRSGQRIALIGPFAGTEALFGPWRIFPGQAPPMGIEQAVRQSLASPELLKVVRGSNVETALPGGIEAAVAAARESDVVLLSIGENEQMSGEARSR